MAFFSNKELTSAINKYNNSSALGPDRVLLLRFNDLRVDQRKKPCIRVNIRKLNRELCIESSTFYAKL